MIAGETRNIGAWAGQDGGGLGLKSVRYACGPPDCFVVVWLPPGGSVEDLKKAGLKPEDICVIK